MSSAFASPLAMALQVVWSRTSSRRRPYKVLVLLDLASKRSMPARIARAGSVCSARVLRMHAAAVGPRSATSEVW